ncbi:MAG: NAD-dependent succinate-semialdehyde dehydrogenase [Aeromicrobium sp.]|uniref:NAD-dependent succinate-semialdehyde dehydrogenase n=1 Tax=Aeromicrobium sp. TaxID=1871063 RepID=UPI002610B654|nr:NAD-dependent succinate-semialdehyde dehydrogenase [Aeromicrobium sp.]MDF1705981.1 NAD-dependent succinate-semialdehyde dehydrogenase [Aeromicrobium sp.]
MASTTTINPATGEDLTTYQLHTDDEVAQIIEATHTAFDSWRKVALEDRAGKIRALGELLRKNERELSELMTTEMGKPLEQGSQEVQLCAAICDWTADNAADAFADVEQPMEGGRAIITHAPIGVIYGIQPWNFPIYQVIRYSVPQLVAGNTVLLKHAESVFGTALRLEELYREAGLPENAFRALLIGHDQSDDVIAHEKVRGVTLTGSDVAGRHVAAKAAEHLKKSVVELGSNDAYLVLSDADVELAVEMSVQGRIANNGQTCVGAKRFVVVDAVYEEFRDGYVEAMKAIELGDPLQDGTALGPMSREQLRDELHDQVTESVDGGATVLVGGEKPDRAGAWYPATVIEDVTPGQPAYDDELFGPVAALIRAKDDEDAMRIANDSRYGLGGGIFSRDEKRAIELARTEFDTGMVNINGFSLAQPNLPFGGVKDSGYGREHGEAGFKEFVNVKTLMIAEA